jgi:hypothetical protein
MRETKAALLAKVDAYKDAERRAPMHARMLMRFVDSGSAGQTADYSASYDVDDSLRFVAFGFTTRHSIDVLIAQIGTGAGESTLHVDLDDVDSFVSRAEQLDYLSEYGRAMKTLAGEFRSWIRARFAA